MNKWKAFIGATAALAIVLVATATPLAQVSKSGTAKGSKSENKKTDAPPQPALKVITIETANLIVQYPDRDEPLVRQKREELIANAKTPSEKASIEAECTVVDPAVARKHADFLQRIFDFYRKVFALDGPDAFNGQKITFFVDALWQEGRTLSLHEIRLGLSNFIGKIYPPNRIFFHEMAHAFQYALLKAGRFYIFHPISGLNEAFAEHFACDVISRFESDNPDWMKYVDSFRTGAWSRTPENTLTYYETNGLDPYKMDWGAHPSIPEGSRRVSGEYIFQQMLMRVVDQFGWDIWPKFFAQTKKASALFEADFKKLTGAATMETPEVRKLFAAFVDGLGLAAGKDLRPMFEAWRFNLSD
jgi:hypothetical protein